MEDMTREVLLAAYPGIPTIVGSDVEEPDECARAYRRIQREIVAHGITVDQFMARQFDAAKDDPILCREMATSDFRRYIGARLGMY